MSAAPDRALEISQAITIRTLAELLAHPEMLQPPSAVIPRLAWAGRVTMLAGREKEGKSTFAAAGCATLSGGGYFLGEFVDVGRVLWLSSDAESLYDQVARLMRFGAEPANVSVVTDWDRTPASFLRAISDGQYKVAVVDTLAAFASLEIADANASALWVPVMLALKRAANEMGTAIILVHHASKTTGRYRDSTAIGAGVDAILELEPTEENTPTRRIRARAKWHLDGYTVRLEGDEYSLEDASALSLEARVLLHVEDHPGATASQIRTAVGGRARDVDEWLRILERRGALEDRGSGARHAYHRTPSPEGDRDGLGTGFGTEGEEAAPSRDGAQKPLRDGAGRTGTEDGTASRALRPSRSHTPVGVGRGRMPPAELPLASEQVREPAGHTPESQPREADQGSSQAAPCAYPDLHRGQWYTNAEGHPVCGVCHPGPRVQTRAAPPEPAPGAPSSDYTSSCVAAANRAVAARPDAGFEPLVATVEREAGWADAWERDGVLLATACAEICERIQRDRGTLPRRLALAHFDHAVREAHCAMASAPSQVTAAAAAEAAATERAP